MLENITFCLSKTRMVQNSKHHEWFTIIQCTMILQRLTWCFVFCGSIIASEKKKGVVLYSTALLLLKRKQVLFWILQHYCLWKEKRCRFEIAWCFWWNTYGFFFLSKIDVCDNENNITQNWKSIWLFFSFDFLSIINSEIRDVLTWLLKLEKHVMFLSWSFEEKVKFWTCVFRRNSHSLALRFE